MATDLEIARKSAPVDVARISAVVQKPGQAVLRDRILAVLKKDPIFDNSVKAHLNHAQKLERIMKVTYRLVQLRKEHNWTQEEWREALRLQDDNIPCMLHENAFIPVIESQGSDEQQAEWLPRSRAYEVLGCYCQTELGHGSNVAGLETTAKFDPATDEFVIQSPRLESSKWWVGALGVLANHTVLQAILYLPDPNSKDGYKSYGPHLFIVPLRSMVDHKPLPGVTVGDIGPKAYSGFGSVDNGFLRLSDVRIPRKNMLQRFAKVDRQGVYSPPKHDKLSYGSMVYLRAGIPEVMGWTLARTVTTAIRYCTVRRQFKAGKTPEEAQVITYAGVKYRLVPLLAKSYTLIFGGRQFWGMYEQMLDGLVKRGDVSMLGEVHTLSTALKATSTWDAVAGMEEARKSMGGHGYSALSGAGHLFANATAAQTYEGDNYVISQQISRSLLKSLAILSKNPQAASSALPKSSSYLTVLLQPAVFAQSKSTASSTNSWLCPRTQLAALSYRAANSVLTLAQKMRKSPNKPIQAYSFDTAFVARAHAELYFATAFYEVLGKLEESKEKSALLTLAQISTLSTLQSHTLPELLVSSFLSASQARDLKAAYEELVDGVSTEMLIALTDAFGFDDWELGVLGRYDGKVYEGLWNEVNRWQGELSGLREEVLRIVEFGRSNVKGRI